MEPESLPEPIAALVRAAQQLPSGHARLAVLEEAVRAADVARDVAVGFWVRRQLIDEASNCLRYDLYAIAFSWCLAMARGNPQKFSPVDLLWHYQYVIGKMTNFPGVSRELYDSLHDDVVREFRAAGFSLRTVFIERRSVANDFADREMGELADREWRKQPRDWLSDNVEYELLRQMEHECFWGNDIAAAQLMDEFAPPHQIDRYTANLAQLALMPLLRLGRLADAAEYYSAATRFSLQPGAGYCWTLGRRLEYLGCIGDFAQGARDFERQLPTALAQSDPMSQYYFLRPSALLLERLAAAGTRSIRLKVPESVPWAKKKTGSTYNLLEVRDWVKAEAASIALQFDERNGNRFYSEWLQRTIEQKNLG